MGQDSNTCCSASRSGRRRWWRGKVMRRKETIMKAGSKVRFHYCYFCDIHLTQGVTDGTSTPFQKHYDKLRANRFFFCCAQLARKPYMEPASRHDLGRMNVSCPDCGALHREAERLSSSSKSKPKFGICCMSGKVKLAAYQDPPEPLLTFLTAPDYFSKRF